MLFAAAEILKWLVLRLTVLKKQDVAVSMNDKMVLCTTVFLPTVEAKRSRSTVKQKAAPTTIPVNVQHPQLTSQAKMQTPARIPNAVLFIVDPVVKIQVRTIKQGRGRCCVPLFIVLFICFSGNLESGCPFSELCC